eukprot:CAMPEP_0114505320 /NCGR_PEP_ID=MMETSP0109-20121206/10792_1 /TAXON_ID=29199 /ORGANISM="Chlorarachnion reptans, Strain CCCM449" /LENGTH=496 /DNA_ID=CAMNT_0001683755 /DNA_START=387 /DNA_END=1877 /DNA_ORIENTATION=-
MHDNPIFHHPAVKAAERVTPVYIFDPRQFEKTEFGSRKTGKFRAQFLLESVSDLGASLKETGNALSIFHDKPENVLHKLADKDSVVVCQEEVTSEELNVDKSVQKQLKMVDSSLIRVWGSTLYHPDDLPFALDQTPEPFTVMRNHLERKARVNIRELFPDPKIPQGEKARGSLEKIPTLNELGFSDNEIEIEPDKNIVLHFVGGESEALKRLVHFTNTALKTYKDTRNGLIGADYSSKYSPWIANGCLSPRYIYWKTREYEESHGGQTVHTYWLIFELMWRDFFKFFCVKHGNSVFYLEGPKGQRRSWNRDSKLIAAWKEGRTGVPWVDANMRELRRTGFMSNRGRQNVASYLVHDLGVDWRFGADHFESLLLDHDVCSNYGNWVAAAGLTGGRINRFNMSKQAKDYDKEGKFVKLWCPELKALPSHQVHAPWELTSAEHEHYGSLDYPRPVKQPRSYTSHGSNGKYGNNKKFKKAKNFKGKGRVHRGRNQDFYTH